MGRNERLFVAVPAGLCHAEIRGAAVGASPGLAAGGGFEVLAHCDRIVVHSNCVLGLVEAAGGVVPSGGGVKEIYLRWHQALGNWDDAAWKAWMNLGYAATGSSPELAARMQYFRPNHDETVMNRDRLLPRAISMVRTWPMVISRQHRPNVQLARPA